MNGPYDVFHTAEYYRVDQKVLTLYMRDKNNRILMYSCSQTVGQIVSNHIWC